MPARAGSSSPKLSSPRTLPAPRSPVARSEALLSDLGRALAEGGLDIVAIFPASHWDEAGPPFDCRAAALLDGARSVIVAGSSGRTLWDRFTAWAAEAPRERLVEEAHPLDRFVAGVLDGAEAILATAGVRARRFEPTLRFQPRLDFRRLAELSGLGCPSPLGMLVHPVYGPWWALRGAWFVDGVLSATVPLARPCDGCPSPCRAAIPAGFEGTLAAATPAARAACVLATHRYSDEQLAYHARPDEGRLALAARLSRP